MSDYPMQVNWCRYDQAALVCLLGLLLLLLATPLLAEEASPHTSRVIDLEHRSSEELLTSLQPHLGSDVQVSSLGQRLLLSGPEAALDEVASWVTALDQPQQEYRLVFTQGQINPEEQQASNRRRYSTVTNELLSLRISEGAPARLERGFWIPVTQVSAWGEQTDYQWMAGGVWVQASPRGDEVVLAFSSRQLQEESTGSLASSRSPSFSASQVQSQLRLQLGRWQLLAREGELAATERQQGRRFSTQQSEHYYSICAEAIDSGPQCPRF